MLGNNENKPQFLSDKALEGATKCVLKKFPQYDLKQGQVGTGES